MIPFKVTGYGDEESGRDHHKLANRFGVADSIRADTTIDLCQFRIITGYRKVGPARRGAAAGS